MKYLKKVALSEIQDGMYNRALDCDVALFNYEFDEAKDPTFLETSLYLYVNDDGGFGHALDFDNVNPNSTVYQTYQALKMFKEVNVIDINHDDISKELIEGAMKYLSKRSRYSIKEKINDKFACALRFKGEDDNELLFGILGYIILFCDKSSKYYKNALDLAKRNINIFLNQTSFDYFTLEQYKLFLQAILLKEEFKIEFAGLEAKYNELLAKYLKNARASQDYFEILEILEDCDLSSVEEKLFNESLDCLIDSRANHGMWENTHKWGNEDIYPEAMSAELKWIGRATRKALHFIHKYGRIE